MRRTLLLLFVSNVTIKGPFDMFIYCPRFPIKWQHSILEFPGSCSGSMPIKLIRINHSLDTIFSALFACALLPIPWKRVGHGIMERTAGSAFSSFLYHSMSLCVSNPTVPLTYYSYIVVLMFIYALLLFCPEFAIQRFATVPIRSWFICQVIYQRKFDYVCALHISPIELEYSLFTRMEFWYLFHKLEHFSRIKTPRGRNCFPCRYLKNGKN